MSVDYTRGPDGDSVNTGDDASMFAPTPIWEKQNRRRRGGGRVQPRSAVTAAEADRNAAMSPNGERLATRERAVARRGGPVVPAAIAIGVIVLAALAAAGWYATRSANGMSQMTPGAPSGAPATAVTPAPAAVASNTPPAAPLPSAETASTAPAVPAEHRATAATTRSSTFVTTRRRAARSTSLAAAPERPVTSPSATGAGVNSSALAPAAPMPSVTPPSSTASPPGETTATTPQ